MSHHTKLSLKQAVLVNFNIMFGTGIFINTILLAKFAGFLGFASYITILFFIAPLVFALMSLIKRYPSGGFYTYAAQTLGPLYGFLSSWSYFIGKLASGSLLIHVFSSLIQTVVPALQAIPTLGIDFFIVALFSWLNTRHMNSGTSIMYLFLILKVTPILTAIICCLYLYNYWSVPLDSFHWNAIPSTLPFVLYAFTGFEASCSISNSIENPEKNGPRAILIAFGLVTGITILYQLLMYLTIGSALAEQTSFLTIFPTLFGVVFKHPLFAQHSAMLVHIALATASLGGAYGILFSVHWNLYTLAQHNHTFFKHALTKLNRYGMPVGTVLVQALVCFMYLTVTAGLPAYLQQLSVFGIAITYSLSILSLIISQKKEPIALYKRFFSLLGILSCLIIFAMIIRNFIFHGLSALVAFVILLLAGLAMYLSTKTNESSTSLRQ